MDAMYFLNLKDEVEHEIVPGYKARFVHTGTMTLAYWNITAGAVLPEHFHFHEQVANVISGTFELEIEGEVKRLEYGDVAVVPGGIKHSGKALTDCQIIDVFYPEREEYKK